MVQIVNQFVLGGGFRHYSGLLPAVLGGGDPFHASARLFAVPAANAAAIFRGDIVCFGNATGGNQGASDIIPNIGPPAAGSVVIGNAGGSLLGNASIAPNVIKWVPGDATTTSIIAGVVVGFGPPSLYMAKNGFQFVPASTQAWVYVETDPDVEMYITMPTVPGTAFNLSLNNGVDVQANAGFQSVRFGISGVSLNPSTIAGTATLPLRILSSGEQIGNDPTAAGFVAKVTFNRLRHYKGNPGSGTTNVPFSVD